MLCNHNINLIIDINLTIIKDFSTNSSTNIVKKVLIKKKRKSDKIENLDLCNLLF